MYGAAPENEQKLSLWQQMEDVYTSTGYWIIMLIVLLSPWLFFMACFVPKLQIFCIFYLLWMYYDNSTPHNGGRG